MGIENIDEIRNFMNLATTILNALEPVAYDLFPQFLASCTIFFHPNNSSLSFTNSVVGK